MKKKDALDKIFEEARQEDWKNLFEYINNFLNNSYKLQNMARLNDIDFDDIKMEVVEKLRKKIHNFEFISEIKFRSWLIKTATNTTLDRIRKNRKKDVYDEELLTHNPTTEDPIEGTVIKDLIRCFHKCIESSCEEFHKSKGIASRKTPLVYVLFVACEIQQEVISKLLSLNENTIASQVSRFTQELFECLILQFSKMGYSLPKEINKKEATILIKETIKNIIYDDFSYLNPHQTVDIKDHNEESLINYLETTYDLKNSFLSQLRKIEQNELTEPFICKKILNDFYKPFLK